MWWLACGAMAAVGSYVLTAGRGDGAGGTREVVARLKGIPALRRAREREAGARVVAACERQMPEMLDILALGLSAGLSFDASLELYCSGSDDELAQRLLATMRGWQMGLEGRREALEGLATRVSAPSLVRFCASVSEALSFGRHQRGAARECGAAHRGGPGEDARSAWDAGRAGDAACDSGALAVRGARWVRTVGRGALPH